MKKKDEKLLKEAIERAIRKDPLMSECVGIDSNGQLIRYNLIDKLREEEDSNDSKRRV